MSKADQRNPDYLTNLELSSDIGRFNSQKEMEVHRLKDDRENGIRVESFQSEQCKKASVQILWLLAWFAGWTFDDRYKRFATASTPP